MPDQIVKQALKDFVATSNSGKYSDEKVLMSKFPELNGYDIQALKDFVATSNSGKYKSEDELFAKFPEFESKKKSNSLSPSSATPYPSLSQEFSKLETKLEVTKNADVLAQNTLSDYEDAGNAQTQAMIKELATADAKKYKQESDELLVSLTPKIEAATKKLVGLGGQFTLPDGVTDEKKIDRYARLLSTSLGGGEYVKEILRNSIRNTEQSIIFQNNLKKSGELDKAFKKATIFSENKVKIAGVEIPEIQKGMTADEYINSQLEKAKKIASQKVNVILNNTKSQAEQINKEYKSQAQEINKKFEPLVISAITEEQRNQLVEQYYAAMKGLKDKANRRLQRQTDELNKQITSEYSKLSIPEEAKKVIEEAYKNAGIEYQANELKQKFAIQEAQQKAIGLTGLFGKSLYSSLLTGIGSRGDAMVGLGFGGEMADWLRGFRQKGLQQETFDLPLTGANWLKPEAYVTRLGKQIGFQLPGMISTLITKNPYAGGILGFIDEQSQNAGEVYNQVLSETGNPVDAQKATVKYLYRNVPSLPLYFLESEMFLRFARIKNPGNFLKNMAVEIPVENFQEAIQGYTGQMDYKDAKTLGQYLKEDFPDVLKETTVTTILQNSVFAGGGKLASVLLTRKTTPEQFARNYIYNLVNDKGLNAANAAVELKAQNGFIDKEELLNFKEYLTKVKDKVDELKSAGFTDEQIRGYVSLMAQKDELQRSLDRGKPLGDGKQMPKEFTPEMRQQYQEKINEIDEQIKKAGAGELESTTITFPSGGSVTLTGEDAKGVDEELKDDIGKNVDLTSTDESVNKKVQEIKDKNPEQINEDLMMKLFELNSDFLDNQIHVKIDDNQNLTVTDLVGNDVDINVLPDDIIQKIDEYQEVLKQLSTKQESKPSKGIVKPSIENTQDVINSLERQRAAEGLDLETTVTQMLPITDQMAEIEKEFEKKGFIIHTDYDTVVVRKKGNVQQDYTEPEDLPDELRDLAAQYEMAFLELQSFDEQATGIALQKSRGVTEEKYEEVSTAKDSDEEGKPLQSFNVGDIVYTNYATGKLKTYWNYSEYEIVELDSKGGRNGIKKYKLRNLKTNKISEFLGTESGFIKKETGPKAEPKAPKEETKEQPKPKKEEKRSETDGKRLIDFKQGDIVYTNWNGKYVEYEIVSTKGDLWKLRNSFGYIKIFNAANNGGFILKETAPKAKAEEQPKSETTKQPEFKEEAPISEVVNVPVSEIKENLKEYQGRKNKFSERSAANVAKNFDINKFDPIVVYKHPDGNTYVLSGHSRLEGMRRRGEKTIPARYFTGTPEEARDFALKSNKLGTLQTDLENAGYYREAMQKGRSYNSLMAEAKETEQEGTATRIMDYAMLNPKGKAYQALESLEAGESDSSTNVKIIAQKVGRIRAKNDHLTDAHENELFDYFLANGFPTDKEINDPNNVINRSINAVKFNPAEPLNLKKVVTKSPERIEWEKELSDLESKISELKKEVTPDKKTGWTGLKEKIIAQLSQNKSQQAIDKAEKDFNNNVNNVKEIYEKKLADNKKQLSVLQDKLAKHLLREKSLIEGEKSQKSLFDQIAEEQQTIEQEAKEETKEEKEVKQQQKKLKRKIRDEKINKEIDDALKGFFGSSPLTSMGLDPVKIEQGTKLLRLYFSQGVYKFSDIVGDIYDRYGREKVKAFFQELKGVYSYFRNALATPEEIDLMDSDIARVTFESIEENMYEDADPKTEFVDSVQQKIKVGESLNIVSLRKIASDLGFEITDKDLQEYVELAIVNLAKEISLKKDLNNQQKFEKIKELYENQPTISMRSSERIEKQQYSTPVPIAYTAGMFAQTSGAKSFLDPSAGNGMLLINVDGSVIANEIDETRLENLEKQGYQVRNQDAREVLPFKVDSVLTNPPFGSSDTKQYGNYKISGLAPQMAINALNTMKDDGNAAIIVGGHAEYDERGVLKGNDRSFLNYLYQNYNVIDVINIDGNLYRKQGTSFPVRMILIGGRRTDFSEGEKIAPLKNNANAEPVKSFDELYNRVKTAQNELLSLREVQKSKLGEIPATENRNVKGVDEKGNTIKDTGITGKPVSVSGTATTGTSAINQPGGPVLRDTEQLRDDRGDGRIGGKETDKVNIEKIQGREGESLQLPGGVDQRMKEIEESTKIKYEAGSKSGEIGSVVPVNMANGIKGVLSQFKDVDQYVTDKLGYSSKEELYQYLKAEQVDGVAIAISQIENGKGAIIGDMTGVGKGRQAAAIIRYAVLNGYKPVFMTEKADLFSDIYRDLEDIGSGDLKPFIVNDVSEKADPRIKVDDGTGTGNYKILHSPPSRQEKKGIYANGIVPKNYDFVLITYSQLNREKPSEKMSFFAQIADGNILIMDESHNSAGDGNTGKFLQAVLPTTKGITFLSATFSKTPSTMPIYGTKTSISDANMSQVELIEAIKKGGAVLQEILSKSLTEIGEYIRRDRDFTGVKMSWETIGENNQSEKDKIVKTFDGVTKILNDILVFQKKYIKPTIAAMNDALTSAGSSAGLTKGTEDIGISNTPFASKIFNITRQLLFSIKAENVADAAISELKKGNKVAIAVSNTMETFLKDLDFNEGLLSSVDYSIALQKALTGVMRYTIKGTTNENTNLSLSIADLPEEGQNEFRRISKEIKSTTIGISISPIDVIKNKIQQAGYNVAEITGRSNQVVLENGKNVLQKRKTDKKEAQVGFTGGKLNNGEKPSNKSKYDAIILNSSGSTGISLHASSTFRDQRPRVMIMAQMQLDVNTEIQMRGRIDRTGQVHRGSYVYLLSPIPAEQRLAMMFIKKLKSLSANTTASQETKEDVDIVDFLNKYGDEKVLEYLIENPEINAKLLDPAKLEGLTPEEMEKTKVENLAHSVSGKVALLTVKEQQDFYNEISERYNAYIQSLEENNENDLKVKILNLKTKTLSKETIIQGKNNKNPFSEDSILEEVEMDNTKFPLFKKEIEKQIEERLKGKTAEEFKEELIDKINDYTEGKVKEERDFVEREYEEKLSEAEAIGNARINAALEQDKPDIQKELEEQKTDFEERYNFKKDSREARVRQRQSRMISFIKKFNIKGIFLVPQSIKNPATAGSSPGIFVGFVTRGKALTPSNVIARFAVLDSRRVVDVALSQTDFLDNVNKGLGMSKFDNWDEDRKIVKSRRKGYIVTGNILQAANMDGKIIKYTTEDGQIKDGILMPDSYKPKNELLVNAIDAYGEFLKERTIKDSTGEVEFAKYGDTIKIYVAKSKSAGGKFFLNTGLRNFVKNNNFEQRGNKMVGEVSIAYGEELFKFLDKEFGMKFSIPKPKALAKQERPKITIDEDKYNDLVKRLNAAFPNVKIITEQEASNKKGGREIMTSDGTVYGLTFPDGSVYLNKEAMNAETPIHEFSHIWESAFPEEWKRGIELMRKSSGFEKALAEIKSNPAYKGLSQAEQESEALNTLIGRKGEGYFKNEALSKFKSWLTNLFVKIAEKLGLGNLISPDTKLNQFANKVIQEMLGGKELKPKAKSETARVKAMAVPSSTQDIKDFDEAMNTKDLLKAQELQSEWLKKYGSDKFKKLRDITRNFGKYVDQLQEDNYIKDKIC